MCFDQYKKFSTVFEIIKYHVRTGMPDLDENLSAARKMNGDREVDMVEGLKFPTSGSPYTCKKKMEMEDEGDINNIGGKKHQMPPASVMTRLVFIMVWRKLIRNPNTYSSILGLTWSLVSFRYVRTLLIAGPLLSVHIDVIYGGYLDACVLLSYPH